MHLKFATINLRYVAVGWRQNKEGQLRSVYAFRGIDGSPVSPLDLFTPLQMILLVRVRATGSDNEAALGQATQCSHYLSGHHQRIYAA